MPKLELKKLKKFFESPYVALYRGYFQSRDMDRLIEYDFISRHRDLTEEKMRAQGAPDAPAPGEYADAESILPVDRAGRKILLTHEFRMPLNRYLLSEPAGLMEPGESPLETVRRELREETGYEAEKVALFPATYSSAGLTDERVASAIVTVGAHGETALEASEDIESRWYSYEEALRLVQDPRTAVSNRTQLIVMLWVTAERAGTADRLFDFQ